MDAPRVWLAVGAVIALASLDLLGAYLAKEFSTRPRWLVLAGGILAFALLFIVYVKSLSVAELWTVTFGWVTLLEIGVVVLDRLRFDTHIPPQKVVLGCAIVILQIALLLPAASST